MADAFRVNDQGVLDILAEDRNAVIQHSLWLVNLELTRSRISLAPESARRSSR